MKKQKLIILVGLPASGKTKYAQEYTKTHADTVIVSTDKIRNDMKELGVLNEDERNVYIEMQHRVKKSLSYGKSVIVNATNLKMKYREPYIYLAKRINPDIVIEAHLILADIDECAETDKIKKQLGLDFLKKCMGEFQLPVAEEGYSQIVYYFNSPKCISQEKEVPVNYFTSLLQRGEFNGMNTFNLSQAISISLEQQGFDKIVQIAGFFALLGKCITKSQEFGQLGAYFILCHLFARPKVVKNEEEKNRWLEVSKLVNYFSFYANWSKRYNKIFPSTTKQALRAIYDTMHSIKDSDEIMKILKEYYGNRNKA